MHRLQDTDAGVPDIRSFQVRHHLFREVGLAHPFQQNDILGRSILTPDKRHQPGPRFGIVLLEDGGTSPFHLLPELEQSIGITDDLLPEAGDRRAFNGFEARNRHR
ncbi:MAG: hypothetical protein M9950_13070 [Thermomicrobiales bacterium]|nr:hypothetical protein [Thermomicrobiales bacterium]